MKEYLRCMRCGEAFRVEEVKVDHVDGGDIGEPHWSCPFCGHDDLDDAYECMECGDVVDEVYGTSGICANCLEKEINFEDVKNFGEQNPIEIDINGLWFDAFTEEEMNRIFEAAFTQLPEQKRKRIMRNYVDNDRHGYADSIM